nr:extracellular solute-binding protein [Moritella yayanosii]
MWNLKEPYFTWPLMAANGGYAFKANANGYDVKDAGVNNAGVKSSMQLVQKLLADNVISPDMDYSVSESEFIKGNVAMTINGPWA